MTSFNLDVRREGSDPVPLVVTPARVYNLGSATVDAGQAVAHQNEVADVGVRIAFDRPAPRVYPMAVSSITTDDCIGVHHERTSGEAELVLVVDDGELYLGIGSDHTDRDLEALSILWSKQYSPSVLGRDVWRWRDVEEDWNQLVLESDVDGRPYQSSKAAVFRKPTDILSALSERVQALPSSYVVYCGTYTTLENTIAFGGHWDVRLVNRRTDDRLAFGYDVVDLMSEIAREHRVPLRPGGE
jgi:hypothetical protein